MEIFKRELFLYRMLAGKLKYPYDNLVIRPPSINLLYDASEIFIRFYNSAIDEGVMGEQEIVNYLVEEGKWDVEKEKMLNEILPRQIEHWKEEIYRAYYQSDKKKTIRKYLEIARQEFNRLNEIRHSYDHISCYGVANYAKLQYIIEHTVYSGKRRYNWSKHSQYNLMSFQQENLIREEQIREISHNHPWYILWQSGKKIGNVFGKPSIKLDFDQQRLVMWSMLYDNVNEQTDTPPQDIIDDDDALDGWLSIKRKEKGEETFSTNNDKIDKAQEIYVPASNMEDAEKVDRLNSQYGKTLKKQRFNAIDKAGELREQDLPDIKQEVMMELNRRYKGGRT